MQQILEQFFHALRSADVNVTPAEAIDAHRTLETVGYGDRRLMRDALCVALAKTEGETERFERCFDAFFSRDEFDVPPSLDDADDDLLANQPLAQLVLHGTENDLAHAMEQAAAEAGVTNIRYMTQRGLMVRRILDGMGLREMQGRMFELRQSDAPGAAATAAALEQARDYLFDQARQFIARQYELYARPASAKLHEEILEERALSVVERRDFETMHRIVKRLAKRLATRYNRRRKHTKRGVLDVRRTLRRNMAYDGIPFETVWKQTKIERPKIVVICDVSQSVAATARFLLLFLYSLNEVIATLKSYAFSASLSDISEILEERSVEDAIPEILEKIGFRPTDYGQAFADFDDAYADTVDRQTTVIILGDGRTNNTDPRLDLMRGLHNRAKAVIWLNPEPETFWGSGDSEMHRYRTFCHVAKTCNTILDLERIIDDVLKSYY